jgi:hypothetical protein
VLGLTLGSLRRRPAWLLGALIAANLAWTVVCVVLAVRAGSGVTVFGHAQILGEGAFVTALALVEWRHRQAILAPAPAGRR